MCNTATSVKCQPVATTYYDMAFKNVILYFQLLHAPYFCCPALLSTLFERPPIFVGFKCVVHS